jgi:hypothetical protein
MSTNSGPVTLDGYGVLSVGTDATSIGTGTLNGSGTGSVSYFIPNLPALIGQDYSFIVIATKAGALGQVSNPVRLVIQ